MTFRLRKGATALEAYKELKKYHRFKKLYPEDLMGIQDGGFQVYALISALPLKDESYKYFDLKPKAGKNPKISKEQLLADQKMKEERDAQLEEERRNNLIELKRKEKLQLLEPKNPTKSKFYVPEKLDYNFRRNSQEFYLVQRSYWGLDIMKRKEVSLTRRLLDAKSLCLIPGYKGAEFLPIRDVNPSSSEEIFPETYHYFGTILLVGKLMGYSKEYCQCAVDHFKDGIEKLMILPNDIKLDDTDGLENLYNNEYKGETEHQIFKKSPFLAYLLRKNEICLE